VTVAPARFDPARLASWTFQHDHWPMIGDIMRAVMQPHARVAVKGCHASGKSFGAADLILVALLAGGDVITTAPTDDQVRGQLWRSVHAALKDSKVPLKEWGEVNQIEIRLPTGERAFGRATNQGVRFQGEHARPGKFLLVIVDEAPGVIEAVMGAIEGMRAGGDVRVLLQGNPLDPAGYFYEAFSPSSGKATNWTMFSIGAFDTPNLYGLTIDDVLAMSPSELDDNQRPYLITRRYVREKYEEWGPDHWEYMGRVLAQFPEQSVDALFARTWLEQAAARPPLSSSAATLTASIDVAGPGEAETVLGIRRGQDIVHSQSWTKADPRSEVMAVLDEWVPRGLKDVNVDSAGIGWYFYVDIEKAYRDKGVGVWALNVGKPSEVMEDDEEGKPRKKYANLKAEYYWRLREIMANGQVSGLPPAAVAQLRTIRYKHPNGVITIESKEDAQKRGIASPDWGEMVMLLFAPEDPMRRYAAAFGKSGNLSTPPRKAPTEKTLIKDFSQIDDLAAVLGQRGRKW
jgi:hypothetical protein